MSRLTSISQAHSQVLLEMAALLGLIPVLLFFIRSGL